MKILLKLIWVILSSMAAGCTTQAWYGGINSSAEYQCKHQPQGEIDRCLARLNKLPYQEYRKLRDGDQP
jgi:hypothetical protein